ncbi:MAG: translation initiation factor IF-2 N-terminal domain-containing protein [Bacillus subtilis]|nr:translation initiation factor IF-2 N-terminal domain-containing protein [Bacillus subtilis]
MITYREGMTVLDLAEALGRTVPEVIRKLMFMKIMASQTQTDRPRNRRTADSGLRLRHEGRDSNPT